MPADDFFNCMSCNDVRNPVHFLTFVFVLNTWIKNIAVKPRLGVLGVHLRHSKDKMYLFQEHSAHENIKYILSLD